LLKKGGTIAGSSASEIEDFSIHEVSKAGMEYVPAHNVESSEAFPCCEMPSARHYLCHRSDTADSWVLKSDGKVLEYVRAPSYTSSTKTKYGADTLRMASHACFRQSGDLAEKIRTRQSARESARRPMRGKLSSIVETMNSDGWQASHDLTLEA